MAIDLEAVPRREPEMAPFEVMISESQERMLAIVRPERVADVAAVCERWGLPWAAIGRVTADGDVSVSEGGRELARIPAAALTSDAIVHDRLAAPPARRRAAPAPGAPAVAGDQLPERGMDPGAVLLALLGSPNLASRRAVFEQYDSTVGTATVAGPGHGAAVLRVRGTSKALVATTDANAPVGAFDPWLGAALSVAEATRNVSITGARPLGVTNCLNFGDPTRPEAFWQLSEAVRGLGDACRALGLPVTGGNVSLYNESPTGAILPTPEIGVVGLLDDVAMLVGPAFAHAGDEILVVGEAGPGLAGSEYARLAGAASEDGPPALDLAREAALQAFVRDAIERGLVASAQDVSGGGLAVALAEAAMWGGLGAHVRIPIASSPAVDLFGESPSRVLMSAGPREAATIVALAREHDLPVEIVGLVGGDRLVIELAGAGATGAAEERGSGVADSIDVSLVDLRHTWDHGLTRALGWDR
jgi:phosphoribosylformylglycinamidine synthase